MTLQAEEWIVVENACRALCEAQCQTFTGVRGGALETCHLAMWYESASSPQIDRFAYAASSLGTQFTVLFKKPSTGTSDAGAEERLYFHHIQSGSLPMVGTFSRGHRFPPRGEELVLEIKDLVCKDTRAAALRQGRTLMATGTCGNEALRADMLFVFLVAARCLATSILKSSHTFFPS